MRTLPYLLVATLVTGAQAARVKDVVSIEGIRDNQLVGYGVVVGLNGTGDKRQTYFSSQTLANLLDRMGVQVPAAAMLVRNTAAVIITANLPPFAQTGSRIDVEVAAIGDATNLQGGLLVLTPLKSATGQVYAVAQGSVVTGGFVAGRGSGNSTTVNHPTAGRIMSGAIVEKLAPNVMPPAGGSIRLQLRRTDFTTAARIANAVNVRFKADLAKCENAGVVAVSVPPERTARLVEFIAEIEELSVMTDMPSRIIINERTGTITAGREIRLRPVSILHGGSPWRSKLPTKSRNPRLSRMGRQRRFRRSKWE